MRKRAKKSEYWQSYSDMMAALLLIFLIFTAVGLVQLNKTQQELNQKIQEYEDQSKKLKEQGDKLLIQKKEMDKLEDQIDRILGIKQNIITSLQDAFADEDLKINIDEETGSIKFEADVFFKFNKFGLLDEGKETLDEAIPVYFGVLLSDEYIDYVNEIVIEGNCDSSGTYDGNLDLSQNRAKAVARWCLKVMEKNGISEEKMIILQKKMNITGKSNSNPVYKPNGKEDKAASRRVEVKFTLKDEETISELKKMITENGDVQ